MAKSTESETSDKPTQKRRTSSGDETRARIVEATLETLKVDGITGTSARAIAGRGDFNQALIFYHFGSVDDVIVAAVAEMSKRRMERHQARLEQAESLTELISIARELHADDMVADNMAVLTQAFAGASGHDELGPKLYCELEPWVQLVADTVDRLVADVPMAAAINTGHLAQGISALFLGIELMEGLDPKGVDADGLFDTFEGLIRIVELLLQSSIVRDAKL